MSRPSEILILTLMHSLWQGGILFLFARLCLPLTNRSIPLIRRNILLILLILQIIASFLTAMQLAGLDAVGFIGNHNIVRYHGLSPLLMDILMAAYILVAGMKLLRFIYGYYRLPLEFEFGKSKAPVDLRLFITRHAKEWGIKRNIDVFVSSTRHSPLTYGLLRPVIMIPACILTGLSPRQLEAILLHELAHIKNLDYPVNGLLLVSESIYFFNPFIRAISSGIRLEQEKECDRIVLDFKHDPVFYAETLLQIGSISRQRPVPVPAFNGKESQLMSRVRFIAELSGKRLSESRWTMTVLLIPAMALTMFGSILDFPQREEDKAIRTDRKKISQNRIEKVFIAAGNKEEKKTETVKSSKKILIPAKSMQGAAAKVMASVPSPQADIDMKPAAAVEYVNIASAKEPPEKKQMILSEEISGGRIIKLGYTLTRHSDKWDYHLDWIRVEEKAPADSLVSPTDLQPQ